MKFELGNYGQSAPVNNNPGLPTAVGSDNGLGVLPAYGSYVDPSTVEQTGLLDFLGKDGLANFGSILKGGASLYGAYNGAQQLKQAQDQFDFSKSAFNRNLNNQAQSVNTRLEDRQRARIGGTGDGNAAGNYESLNTYLTNNKVNGSPIK